MSNAKSLITGAPVNENDGNPPTGGPGSRPPMGGPPRRERPPGAGPRGPRGPGGPGGPGAEPEGMLTPQERDAFKDLVILDLLQALGGDPFYTNIANAALKGTDPDPGMIRHFLDEAGKYAKSMSPEVNALMGKLSSAPR